MQICVGSEMVRECCYPSPQTNKLISGRGLPLHRSGCGLPLPPGLLVLGRTSFFKPSGVWQTIPNLPGSAGPSDIHASWGWNRKCASLGESRTKILEFHQWGAVMARPLGMGILRLRLRAAFYNFKALTPQSQHTTQFVVSCRACSTL
jgi:hypothetical protein